MSSSQPSKPSMDRFGLPLSKNEAAPVSSSTSNSFGELSNNRSIGMLGPNPTSLTFGGSPYSGRSVTGSPFAAPLLKSSSIEISFPKRLREKSSYSSNWKISPGMLECKPPHYQLDPQSRMVTKSNANDIAARVSDCLRRRSIAAKFSTDKAKAKCVTSEGVEFRIRLFAGKGKFVGGVIVEVQRRSGWKSSYQQDCFAILESAECDVVGDCDNLKDSLFVSNDLVEADGKETKCLELAKKLLSNSLVESNMLGLESLTSLTDSRKCGEVAALRTARALFDSENSNILEIVKNLATDKKMISASLSEEALKRAHFMSLTTLMNSTSLLSQSRELTQVIVRNAWIENLLVPALMTELNDTTNPHKGATAARCLNTITCVSIAAAKTAIDLGALRVLETVHKHGTKTHANLARETSQTRKNLLMT